MSADCERTIRKHGRPRCGKRVEQLPGALCLAALLGWTGGCVQQMANQPRVEPAEPVAFFADGLSVRPAPEGTVARGQLPEAVEVETGMQQGEPIEAIPLAVTQRLMRRGRERYTIFCSHCHGPAGYGDGLVVQRGFPAPPSYHIRRLEDAPDGHIFQVITNGHGRMPAFGKRISPRERWSIVAYVRALQLSQNVPLRQLPDVDRQRLEQQQTSGDVEN